MGVGMKDIELLIMTGLGFTTPGNVNRKRWTFVKRLGELKSLVPAAR